MPLGWLGINKGYILRALLLIAHKMITVNWLKPFPLTLDQWKQGIQTVWKVYWRDCNCGWTST